MRHKNKFTLLELLIACAVTAIITAVAGAVIYTFPRSYEEMEMQTGRLQQLMAMEGYADNIVKNAIPLSWKDHNGSERQIFYGDKDIMILASRNPSAESEGPVFSVMGIRNDQVVVQYRNTPVLFWEKESENIMPETLTEEIIADGVESLQIYYGQWENGVLVWLEDWDEETNRNKTYLPPVIAWKVVFEDGSIINYIRRTCGNSYYSSYGRRDAN